jgi:hypothetical protein
MSNRLQQTRMGIDIIKKEKEDTKIYLAVPDTRK